MADAKDGRPNYCEWIASCFLGDPRVAVKNAVARRHRHQGYMAEYRQDLAFVQHANEAGEEPLFASWF